MVSPFFYTSRNSASWPPHVQHMVSDVPARLGLKAPALAWPRRALAFQILEPSRGPKPGQSRGSAWPGDGFREVSGAVCYETCSTASTRRYEPLRPPCSLANVSHTSIDVRCTLRGDWVVAGWVATEVGTYRGDDDIIVVVYKCARHWRST